MDRNTYLANISKYINKIKELIDEKIKIGKNGKGFYKSIFDRLANLEANDSLVPHHPNEIFIDHYFVRRHDQSAIAHLRDILLDLKKHLHESQKRYFRKNGTFKPMVSKKKKTELTIKNQLIDNTQKCLDLLVEFETFLDRKVLERKSKLEVDSGNDFTVREQNMAKNTGNVLINKIKASLGEKRGDKFIRGVFNSFKEQVGTEITNPKIRNRFRNKENEIARNTLETIYDLKQNQRILLNNTNVDVVVRSQADNFVHMVWRTLGKEKDEDMFLELVREFINKERLQSQTKQIIEIAKKVKNNKDPLNSLTKRLKQINNKKQAMKKNFEKNHPLRRSRRKKRSKYSFSEVENNGINNNLPHLQKKLTSSPHNKLKPLFNVDNFVYRPNESLKQKLYGRDNKLKPLFNMGGSQFIHVPNHGKRKVRYQKNGRAYVIVKGKKLKLN